MGPPSHPATVEHEVNPPTSLEFTDGFADEAGAPNTDMSSRSARWTPCSPAEESDTVVRAAPQAGGLPGLAARSYEASGW